ncbi:hypothetical protein [Streptosporangium sp. NPDC049644]|uniref:hypothetical protein n=1 Tax=Streptosporangium sp. NPDC049644 TaxID=3155507 RepID=UPI00343854A5
MDGLAERIGNLCALLGADDDLSGYVEQAGAGETLAAVVDALGRGEYGAALERDLDALDEAMARFGLGAVTTSERVYRPVAVTGGGHPVVQAWACPLVRRCGRVEPVTRESAPPVCAALGTAMALVRVPT